MVGTAWNGQRPASTGSTAGSVAAGLVAALVGAIGWAVIVAVSGYKIGFAAVAIGLLVGQAMAVTASRSPRLPLIAAGLALVGGVLGDLFVDLHTLSRLVDVSALELISHPDLVVTVFKAGFVPQDVAFWAVAAAAGYRLTARGVQRQDRRPVAAPATARPSGPDFRGVVARPPVPAPAAGPVQHPSQFFNSATTKPKAPPLPMPRPTIAMQLAVTIQDTVTPRVPAPPPAGPIGPDGRPLVPAQLSRPQAQPPSSPAPVPVRRAPRPIAATRDF